METQKRNNIIVNGMLIVKAIAIACSTAGFLNALNRDTLVLLTLTISLAVLATIYIATKQKTIKNIIENAKLHKAIRLTCDIIIVLSITVLVTFIFTSIILMIINIFISLFQAIF